MRILLCGEGPHEVGQPRVWDSRTRTFVALEGWMQALGRRLIAGPVEFEVRMRRDLFIEARLERSLGTRPAGHGRKSKLARWIASNEEFDAVIYMVDADSPDPMRWTQLVREIVDGFESLPAGPPAVPCVPLSASESWLLGDGAVWAALSGRTVSQVPAHPEEIWGKRDNPRSDHPHHRFRRVCEEASLPDDRDTRIRIAKGSKIETIRRRCPVSFPPFADEVNAL